MEQYDLVKREKAIIKTSIIGILGNVALVGFKATVGLIAGSIAIILDAVNNLTDALSSIITMIGTKIAGKKPDKNHPYGHGRSEYLASMAVGIIVTFAGGLAVYEAVRGIIADPTCSNPPAYDVWMLIIVGVAVLTKVALGLYFRHNGKKWNSEALKDSGIDALFDAILSLSTLVAALVSFFTHFAIENYLGALIGLFILRAGIKMLIRSYSLIIGERVSKEETQALRKAIGSYPEVKGVYDLILHNYGPNRSIGSAHIEVDDSFNAKQIHDLTRRITGDIYLKTGIILTLGVYASNDSSPLGKEIKDSLLKVLKDYPSVLQIHGFYVREEEKFCSFDLIFDFADKDSKKAIEGIRSKMKEIYPEFTFYVVEDLDFAD